MADGENEKHPVRKLTVKNFSVIKEAELEFGKITVLIGPQASGKSLLCKLAYFLGQIVPEIIQDGYTNNLSFASVILRIDAEFKEKFPERSWSGQEFQISYRSDDYLACIAKSNSSDLLHIEFGEGFNESFYNRLLGRPGISRVIVPSRIRKYQEIQGITMDGPPLVEGSVYIPTGRSFYSIPNRAFAALSTKNLDWITQRYAPEFDAEYKALLAAYNGGLTFPAGFGKLATQILKGKVVQDEGRLAFESNDDDRRRPFELLSSGTLEMLPLINSLSQLVWSGRYPDVPTMPAPPFGAVYIEEPELSVFPSTQYDLLRLIALIAWRGHCWMSFAITTHSPYILTSFNNLILAGQLAKEKPDLKNEISKIVEEQYWIEGGTFRAYSIHDGVLESILSESGLINGEYLDNVSDVIGNQFDSLLKLEYDHTEAS